MCKCKHNHNGSFTQIVFISLFIFMTVAGFIALSNYDNGHFHQWYEVGENRRTAGVVLGRREHFSEYIYKCGVCGRTKRNEISDLF